jgi:hypothetical protein
MGHLRPLPIFCLLLLVSCSERVVDTRAYGADGVLAWTTVMPSSRNTALWVRYAVAGPAVRATEDDRGRPRYDFTGSLDIKADKRQHYHGAIFLRPEGVVLDKMYNKGERDGVLANCGFSTCTESGRIKLMSLHEVEAGAVLDFQSRFSMTIGDTEITGLSLELAPN